MGTSFLHIKHLHVNIDVLILPHRHQHKLHDEPSTSCICLLILSKRFLSLLPLDLLSHSGCWLLTMLLIGVLGSIQKC